MKCRTWLLYCSVSSEKERVIPAALLQSYSRRETFTWDKVFLSGYDSNPAGTLWSNTNCNHPSKRLSAESVSHLDYPSISLVRFAGVSCSWLFLRLKRKQWKYLWSWAFSIAPSVPSYTPVNCSGSKALPAKTGDRWLSETGPQDAFGALELGVNY